MSEAYMTSVRQQFEFYKKLGDKTFAQLSNAQLFHQFNPESNSIGLLVQHMSGNLLSRFTDFLTQDGEKEWRNRDGEFEVSIRTREELLDAWEKGWACLFDAINPLVEADQERIIYVRNQGHTVIEALNRAMAHASYHVGQIVQLGVIQLGKDWKSLSIPRGQSTAFNESMFAQPKRREHFTETRTDRA